MWQFNYIVDVQMIHDNLHPSTRHTVGWEIVVGNEESNWSTKITEDACRLDISDNVRVSRARLPMPVSCHHTKMMVLFFNDDGQESAQIVIHTASMRTHDWTNLCQGVWESTQAATKVGKGSSGEFERYLLDYLRQYRLPSTGELVKLIQKYDWSKETAKLVASVPGPGG